MGRLEELCEKESKLWEEVKSRYEMQAACNNNKIIKPQDGHPGDADGHRDEHRAHKHPPSNEL